MPIAPLQPAALLPGRPVPASTSAGDRRFWLRPPGWRSLVWIVAAVLLAAGIAFSVWHARLSPITVRVASLAANVPVQVFGLGTVGARVQSNVGFKVAGVLVALNADQGDHVPAGSILARLEDRDVRAQLAAARAGVVQADASIGKAVADVGSASANLTNAEQISSRRDSLVRTGVVSKEEAQTSEAAKRVARANLQVAQSEVVVAQAALAAARAQETYAQVAVDNTILYAPYDSWVVSLNLQLGSMPVPGQPVFTLVDPQTIWVLGYVDERLAGRIAVGQQAEIVLRSDPARRLPAHVARIEIQSDAVNQERLVEVAFDRVPPDIHLAEQAEVSITTEVLPQALLVPPGAVTGRDGHSGTVWTVEAGQLQRRQVSFGPELLDGSLPIIAGLPAGAQVVVSPMTGLTADRTATVTQDGAR
jgi:HlyD family secretion protein